MASRYAHWLPKLLALCLGIGVIANLWSGHVLFAATVLIGAGLVLGASHLLAPKLATLTPQTIRRGITLAFGLMIIAQIVILATMPVTVYHDPYRVLAQADQMAAGHAQFAITYFWRYPNNVALAYGLSLWLRFTNLLGLSTNLAIAVLSMVTLDGFIALLLHTVWQVSKRPAVLVASAAFLMATPFAYTYFLQVFYSDLPAMFVLLAVFALLHAWPHAKRHWLIGIAIVVLVALGQLLKPNLIVLLPAIVLVVARVRLMRRLHWQRLVPLALVLLGLGFSVPAKVAVNAASGFHADTTYQLPATHWTLMGLNANTDGMYSGGDVGHAISLHNTARVQAYDLTTIKKRIVKLGPLGLVRLWVTKLGILQRVSGMQNWYNGGLRNAPGWYLAQANFWSQLTAISYTIAVVSLLLTLSWRLWHWRADLTSPQAVLILLAVTTILGLFAFHTLLWEVESRYGQIVLPLLWLVLAGMPAPAPTAEKRHWLLPSVGLILLTAVLSGAAMPVTGASKAQVVSAQRSQLSTQYHAKPHKLEVGQTLKEAVTLSGTANYLSVQTHTKTTVTVTLTAASGRVYHLYQAGSVYRLHAKLAAGTYTIAVTNHTHKPQLVDVVKTYHYQLAKHPLILDGKADAHASLVFTSMRK